MRWLCICGRWLEGEPLGAFTICTCRTIWLLTGGVAQVEGVTYHRPPGTYPLLATVIDTTAAPT